MSLGLIIGFIPVGIVVGIVWFFYKLVAWKNKKDVSWDLVLSYTALIISFAPLLFIISTIITDGFIGPHGSGLILVVSGFPFTQAIFDIILLGTMLKKQPRPRLAVFLSIIALLALILSSILFFTTEA